MLHYAFASPFATEGDAYMRVRVIDRETGKDCGVTSIRREGPLCRYLGGPAVFDALERGETVSTEATLFVREDREPDCFKLSPGLAVALAEGVSTMVLIGSVFAVGLVVAHWLVTRVF